MERKELKILFLKTILEKKTILFGAFSPILTKELKNKAWAEVHNTALALGLVPRTKDYTYTRDVLWQNLKKASVKKRDNSRQTGSGGGGGAKFSSIDELIYEIIGKESPILDGLPILESPRPDGEISVPREQAGSSQPSVSKIKKLNKTSKNTKKKNEILKNKKLELTVEFLKLKILKLKKELGITDISIQEVDGEAQEQGCKDMQEEYLESTDEE